MQSNRNNKILMAVIGVVLVLLGLSVFLYPVISNQMASKNQAEAIQVYDKTIENTDSKRLQNVLDAAQEYNEALQGDPVHDPFVPGSGYALPENYKNVLNPNGDGIMGYLEIPKIDVRLPIGHGTSEEVMKKNLGHIESTALPIGGKGNHAVLTGHRGLPSAELLTRLDELKKGDLMFVKVLGKTLAYRVDKISVVLPDELVELRAENDKDFLTVLTCTPYGINTHRLLVRGERTEYVPEEKKTQQNQAIFAGLNIRRLIQGVILGIIILIVAIIIFVKVTREKRRRARRRRLRQ